MSLFPRNISLFAVMALLIAAVGFLQSWDVSLALLNLCIISAIMAQRNEIITSGREQTKRRVKVLRRRLDQQQLGITATSCVAQLILHR